MALKIRLTSSMTAEEMTPHWPDIIKCLERYVRRFEGEETIANIIKECATGQRQLWICQDETGRVVLTPITEIETTNATGKKTLLLAEVGGSRLRECMPLLEQIEAWAKHEHGATESRLVGRSTKRGTSGWSRHLLPLGYEPSAIIYRKEL